MIRIFLAIASATALLCTTSAASPTLPKRVANAAKKASPAAPDYRKIKVASITREEPKGAHVKAYPAGLCSSHIGLREVCVGIDLERIHVQEGVGVKFTSHVAFERKDGINDANALEHVARVSIWIFGTIAGATDKTSYDCEYRILDETHDVTEALRLSGRISADQTAIGRTIGFFCLEQNGPPGARLMIVRDKPPETE